MVMQAWSVLLILFHWQAPGIIQQGFKWMLDSKVHYCSDLPLIWILFNGVYHFINMPLNENVINHIGLMNGLLNYSKKLYLSVELQGVIPLWINMGSWCFVIHNMHWMREIELSHKAARLGIEKQNIIQWWHPISQSRSQDDWNGSRPLLEILRPDPIYLMNELKLSLQQKSKISKAKK